MSDEFTHFNSVGQPYMIDVGNKAETNRKAVAKARIFMALSTIEKIKNNEFNDNEFIQMGQQNIKTAQLNSIRDNKKFDINAVKILYSLPINSFTLINDEKNNIYLAKIKKIES